MTSLRQRRREQTAATIRRAAIDLAHLHGLDQITTEMISEAAGISPRTFFNYFPFKEAALAPPRVGFEEADKLRFVQGKGKLLKDLANMLAPMLSCIGDDRETMCKSHMVALGAPKLLALQNALFLEFEEMIAELLGKRLKRDPSEIDLRHMAALVTATVRMGFAAWIEDEAITLAQGVEARLLAVENLFAVKTVVAELA